MSLKHEYTFLKYPNSEGIVLNSAIRCRDIIKIPEMLQFVDLGNRKKLYADQGVYEVIEILEEKLLPTIRFPLYSFNKYEKNRWGLNFAWVKLGGIRDIRLRETDLTFWMEDWEKRLLSRFDIMDAGGINKPYIYNNYYEGKGGYYILFKNKVSKSITTCTLLYDVNKIRVNLPYIYGDENKIYLIGNNDEIFRLFTFLTAS